MKPCSFLHDAAQVGFARAVPILPGAVPMIAEAYQTCRDTAMRVVHY